ncbi:neural cell adhesion molecule 1-like isoform X2 [Oscarella lobularis]|uniref:neural cell adhesion molecule 1-like isoform X2 n=1 Tax=Oscarella lobularis TaxID=121494 RepID=UPI0033133E58
MRSPRKLGSAIVTIAFLALSKGASSREKDLAANVDDSVWALNGDTVVLNCSHPDTIGDVWSQRAPDGTVSSVSPAAVQAFVGGSMLTLSMSPSLNGTSYRCVLTDLNVNRLFESGWITVLLGDAINMTCASQATVCATETQTLMKRCTISGLPTPIITVQKMSGTPSSLPSASLSGLTFSAVTLEDRGVYTVTGKNILEEKRFNVSVQLGVDICVAPMMVNISIPDTIGCLNLALINYTAKGLPAPNITWNSSVAKRTVVHAPKKYSTGITSFVESTLGITAQREDNQISFCVTAENSVASTSQCYSRNVTCSPGAPFVQVVNIGDTSFNLNIIEPQFNGGNEVLSYNISVSSSDTLMETYNVPRTGKETLYVVKGLSPNTSYTISVTAVNDIGKGPPFIFSNETAGRPGGVGEGDVVQEKGCKELSFTFMEIDDNGGPITNHRVLLYSEQDVLLRNESSSSTTVTIDGLDPKTMYVVQLQVENEYGESVVSAAFIVITSSCGLGTGPIVGILLGSGVVLIACCAGVIIIVKKKNSGGCGSSDSPSLKADEKADLRGGSGMNSIQMHASRLYEETKIRTKLPDAVYEDV